MKMGMLAAAHAFAFGALQGALIGLPGLENGKLLRGCHVICGNDIRRMPEASGRIDYGVIYVPPVIHAILLLSLQSIARPASSPKHRHCRGNAGRGAGGS